MVLPFQGSIFRFHVSFLGGKPCTNHTFLGEKDVFYSSLLGSPFLSKCFFRDELCKRCTLPKTNSHPLKIYTQKEMNHLPTTNFQMLNGCSFQGGKKSLKCQVLMFLSSRNLILHIQNYHVQDVFGGWNP